MGTSTRPLPIEALFELGTIGLSSDAVAFVHGCRDDGFSIEQPGDELLTEDEWREVVTARCRILASAWRDYRERMGLA